MNNLINGMLFTAALFVCGVDAEAVDYCRKIKEECMVAKTTDGNFVVDEGLSHK